MNLKVPEKLQFIPLERWRIKGAYGGRGAGKSWTFADSLLSMIVESPKRVFRFLCTRELQVSIKDSVHKLISDRIDYHKLNDIFDVYDHSIAARNGSHFIFQGLRSNINEIKSLEGVDICWVEEAEMVSEKSWEILIPTIRKEGMEKSILASDESEIWVGWNTGTKKDPVYKMLVECPRPDAKVVKVNYYDNPWFPNVLRKEMELCKATDEKKYKHIWLGDPGEGGLFFSNFDKELMAEQPFVIPPHMGERSIYGGFDFGWGETGHASYGHNYLDGHGVPHRMLHWYKPNMTAQEQADDLFEEIAGFYFTSGVFPLKIAYDYEMDVSGKNEQGEWAPIDYFKERWKKGGQNPNAWVKCNKKRISGWQVVTDYLGRDVDKLTPKMRYWPQYNKDWVASMESAEADEKNPLDLAKSNSDHPCDETRYCFVMIRGILVAVEIGRESKPAQARKQKRDVQKILAGMSCGNTGF